MKKIQCLACGKEAYDKGYLLECSDEGCGFRWLTYSDGSSCYWREYPYVLKDGLWDSREVECPFGCLLVVSWEEL